MKNTYSTEVAWAIENRRGAGRDFDVQVMEKALQRRFLCESLVFGCRRWLWNLLVALVNIVSSTIHDQGLQNVTYLKLRAPRQHLLEGDTHSLNDRQKHGTAYSTIPRSLVSTPNG